MATYNAFYIQDDVFISIIRMRTLAGSVVDADANPARREILIYKDSANVGENNVFLTTYSDETTGQFSVDVPCGTNDRMRVVCVGGIDSSDNSENSLVYDNISG